ncbi:unnamed protein product [Calypogeia fissa]
MHRTNAAPSLIRAGCTAASHRLRAGAAGGSETTSLGSELIFRASSHFIGAVSKAFSSAASTSCSGTAAAFNRSEAAVLRAPGSSSATTLGLRFLRTIVSNSSPRAGGCGYSVRLSGSASGVTARGPATSGALLTSRLSRTYSNEGDKPEEGDKSVEEKPVRRKKLTKRQLFGKYGQDFDDEMAQIPIDESIEHLYDARPIFEEWMGHPTFYDMISADAYPKKGAPKDEPPGEGPILRWETRVVLSPGGDAFHPKNRKVKVSVYVKELGLTPVQKERLLFMVGKRYNPNKDELTIISERFDQREENRKDVLRTLLALIEEAQKEDDASEDAQTV